MPRQILSTERTILEYIGESSAILFDGNTQVGFIKRNEAQLDISEYDSAFHRLVEDGFITNESGQSYILTGVGLQALQIIPSPEDALRKALLDWILWAQATVIDDRLRESIAVPDKPSIDLSNLLQIGLKIKALMGHP